MDSPHGPTAVSYTHLDVYKRQDQVEPHQAILNGADGLEFQTTVDARFLYVIHKDGVSEVIGRVSPERRRVIGRKVIEVLRLLLWGWLGFHCGASVVTSPKARKSSSNDETLSPCSAAVDAR